MTLLPTETACESCEPLGTSGLSRPIDRLPERLDQERLMILRGFVYWDGDALQRQIAEGRYVVLSREDVPWQELWDLSAFDEDDANLPGGWTTASLGVGVWQGAVARGGGDAMDRPAEQLGVSLGDLALLEWAKVFCTAA